MEGTSAHYDVRLGDVSESQVVIGDHTNVFTPHGVKVVKIVSADERPRPRRRSAPVIDRPAPPATLVGREEELAACAEASGGSPLQLHGPEGVGKTTLLKRVANTASAPPDGAVFLRARRRSLDDVEAMLFDEFWESDARFVPGPGELPRYLADVRALIVIDDLELDRDDVDSLLDAGPNCTLVVGSVERALWDRGRALPVRGLDADAGTELIARVLGRPLTSAEAAAARTVSEATDGLPQSLVEVAALVREGHASLKEISTAPAEVASRVPEEALTPSQRRILAVLAAMPGTTLGPSAVAHVAAVPDPEREIEGLERLGLVRGESPRWRLEPATARRFESIGQAELVRRLAGWVDAQREPEQVANESEAIEAAIELGARDGRGDEVLALARAAEAKLGVAGLLGGWQRVLSAGLDAARARGREADEAYMLHQLGSRALLVGATGEAAEQLRHALEIRERIGDTEGAELTRANLDQVGGRRRWAPRGLLAALGVVLVAAGAGLAVALSGGLHDGGTSSTTDGTEPTPRLSVVIEEPAQDALYGPSTGKPRARFACRPPKWFRRCGGVVRGVAVKDGDTLDWLGSGGHELVVTGTPLTGEPKVRQSHFNVDFVLPTISLGVMRRSEGDATVTFSCNDDFSGPNTKCVGVDLTNGKMFQSGDTLESRADKVRVTAVDEAGNKRMKTDPPSGAE